ncbi:MAG: esterase [Acidobacteriota bacterium]|nr:MAG: esterase [Acidobacteriota bacterium]
MEARAHRLVVPRTAQYVTLGDVDGTDDLQDVWFLCHGYGQLASQFLDSARALEHPGRVLVAPEALSRFYLGDHKSIGASWMTREDREREMEDYIRYLDLLHERLFEIIDRASVRLVVLGYSQGAATAARWAVRGRVDVDHLVLWAAAIPPELDDDDTALASLKAMRVTLVGGSRDALFPEHAREEQRSRLRRNGVTFSELSFAGGHRLDDETLLRLAAS